MTSVPVNEVVVVAWTTKGVPTGGVTRMRASLPNVAALISVSEPEMRMAPTA